MLPLSPFTINEPNNLSELKSMLKSGDNYTKIMAGGTDLLPNLKHGLYNVKNIISLRKLNELRQINIEGNKVIIGANVTLSELAKNLTLQKLVPIISETCLQIASPQIRNMATVGGNICLDTRCLYINQSEFWRSALGYCLKKDGSMCHVVKTGKRCVAAASNDLATSLLALDAEVLIVSPTDEKIIKLKDLYTANGIKNQILKADEIIAQAQFTLAPKAITAFYKLRHRASIDFSMLSIGLMYFLTEQKYFERGTLVVNALTAKPKIIDLNSFAKNIFDEILFFDIAKYCANLCHPQTNICDDTNWRKHMLEHSIEKLFLDHNFSSEKEHAI